jgi:hypothetical protein
MTDERGARMRPRTIIYLVVLMAVLGLGGASFWDTVVSPHSSGQPMEGMVMSGDAAAAPEGAADDGATEPTAAAGSGSPDQAAQTASDEVLPASLAGLDMVAWIDGDPAKAQTEQLHGKGLGQGFDEAWIARYGDGAESTLWVSRSASADDAETLMDRMTVSIEKGTSPFTNLTIEEVDEVEVVALDGMGQKHYYFRVANDLYWLGIEPALGQQGLEELVRNAKKVAGL